MRKPRKIHTSHLLKFEFDVLIADGAKDSQDHIIFYRKPTLIEFPKTVPIYLGGHNKKVVGKVKIWNRNYVFKVRFVEIDLPYVEEFIHLLTPSIVGQIKVRDENIMRYIIIEGISLDASPNVDNRIQTLGDQYKIWEEQLNTCSVVGDKSEYKEKDKVKEINSSVLLIKHC